MEEEKELRKINGGRGIWKGAIEPNTWHEGGMGVKRKHTERRKNEIEERRLEKKRKRGDMRRDRRRLAAAAPIKP